MSSAILYLAIVAIWACVLIPRWLRRDSARGASAPVAEKPPVVAEPEATDDPLEEAGETDATADGEILGLRARVLADHGPRVAEPLGAEESRRRMLAARRRLLLMLIGLEVAAIALSVLGLAAVWVVIPPSIMLIGYLLLLREAGQADAERAQYEAEAAERARARLAHARRVTPVEGTPTDGIAEAAAALAAKLAAAPVPADSEDPGRDFAPGLAGKYTTSNADVEPAEDDNSDAYDPPRLRAVGD
jgi:hypothetical protein